jgi:hypothetical protein
MIGTKNDSKNEVIFVFLFFIQESRSQIYVWMFHYTSW